jgi:hypothetical protein
MMHGAARGPESRSRQHSVRGGGATPAREMTTHTGRHDFYYRLIAGPLGGAIARPWFHGAARWALMRWFFPLSRLWAAASVAEGSVERFAAAVPYDGAGRRGGRALIDALSTVQAVRERAEAARAAWEEAVFGGAEVPADDLAALEAARREASHAYMMQRFRRPFWRLARRVPSVHFEIPAAAEVEAAYGVFTDAPEGAFALPSPLPAVARSAPVPSVLGRKYWLRFASPSSRITAPVYATVHEPAEGAADMPSLIFGHGIGVESDLWRETVESALTLVPRGVRVVELTAPWHGLRAVPGRYGGEPVLAAAPLGALDLFTAAVREMGVLIGWCRNEGSRAVALGGISLGAQLAQLALVRAAHWPKPCRPDAALLLTHAGSVEEVTMTGDLTRGLGLPQALQAAGWAAEGFSRWRALTDPIGPPCIEPSRIVSVLGRRDDVTPFASGQRLVRDWKLPEENVFILDQGHFSAPLALLRDRRPFDRLLAIIDAT